MGSHDPFGHLQHKLWPKEGSRVKLAVWLPGMESRESTQFLCVQVVYDMLLESFRRGLQLWFRPHPDRRSEQEVIDPQSCGTRVNQLVYWFCVGLLDWMSCLTLVLVPSQSSSMPLYPSKVLRARSAPRNPNLFVVSILRFNLNLPRGLGARHIQWLANGQTWSQWKVHVSLKWLPL
jgi:hypothetical protein